MANGEAKNDHAMLATEARIGNERPYSAQGLLILATATPKMASFRILNAFLIERAGRMERLLVAVIFLIGSLQAAAVSPDVYRLTGPDAEIWAGLEESSWIAQGNGARIVYAVIDPNCTYCRDLYKRAKQSAATSVQIRWVPVGWIGKVTEDSRYKAASAMKGGLTTLDAVMRGGGPDVMPSQREFTQIDSNGRVLGSVIGKYTNTGVPKLIYVKDGGKEVRLFTGVPAQSELTKALQ